MLVLSRREQETIVIPAINTTIQLLKMRGQVARIGIDAPGDLQILRGEIVDQSARRLERQDADLFEQLRQLNERIANLRELNHALRNRLNEVNIAAAFARALIDRGRFDDARDAIQRMLDSIAAEVPSGAAERGGGSNRPRTLIVEDNANERHLMAGFLRASGFEVDVAGDGDEALSHLSRDARPDVVLMDMTMPRCDGPTAVRQIRSTPALQGLKIFAISGTTQSEVGLEIGPGGVDRWYSKPLNPDHLLGELTQELQTRGA